ncbi:MAG: phage minor capsid protein [Clostridiales bacterium]
MINQSTYENLSSELVFAAELLVWEVGGLLLKLNKLGINNPGAVVAAREKYETGLTKAIKKYKKSAIKWINEDVAKAYIAGLTHSNSILRANNLKTSNINSVLTGSFLIKSPPPIPPIPPITGQQLAFFEGWQNHTQFFGVFRNAAYYSIDKQPLQILRAGNDLYRDVSIMVGEQSYKESDIFTRRRMSQALLNEYSKKGLQAIRYKDGRNVSIDTYSEMLGRTITGRAAVQASLNRFVETGYPLCVVSAHFRACPLCTPYEGKILSVDGRHPDYESVADAETQGLFHPNCLHDISVYIEGVSKPLETRTHPREQKLIDEYGYEEAQRLAYQAQLRQRAIERNIRAYKRRSNTSLDKKTEEYNNKKTREWQAKQRDHLKENKFLRRKYEREQIKKAR